MKLIIFDIDGTLTSTNQIDTLAFKQTIREHLGISDLNTHWHEYTYSTDSGILLEIFQTHLNREPADHELQRVEDYFVSLIKAHLSNSDKGEFTLLGANKIFDHINALGDWHIAIATGGWLGSALLKLDHSNIPHTDVPKAYGNDHIERSEIIKVAISRAKQKYDIENYQQTIYVGDRFWDYSAASRLNIEFIGVGNELHQQNTHQFETVLDYSNPSAFIKLIELA